MFGGGIVSFGFLFWFGLVWFFLHPQKKDLAWFYSVIALTWNGCDVI